MFGNTTAHCTLQLMRDDPVFLIDMTVTFPYAGSSIQNTSEQFISCIHLPFVNSALHPTPQQKSNTVTFGDSNSSILITIQI
jgi:hypothetical protein